MLQKLPLPSVICVADGTIVQADSTELVSFLMPDSNELNHLIAASRSAPDGQATTRSSSHGPAGATGDSEQQAAPPLNFAQVVREAPLAGTPSYT